MSTPGRHSGYWVVAAVLLALGAITAGIWSHTRSAPPVAVRVPVGEASPPTRSDVDAGFDAETPPVVKIPERLPEFSLSDTVGKATPISRWGGRSLVLNFWATWCAPCRREIPLLKSLSDAWAGRDVQVIGIAVDYRDKVVAYAASSKIPYPLLVGEQDALDVAAKLGVDSPVFPFTVFTDKRGEVVALYLGELHRAQADLILAQVQALNADQVRLDQARHHIAEGLQALGKPATG